MRVYRRFARERLQHRVEPSTAIKDATCSRTATREGERLKPAAYVAAVGASTVIEIAAAIAPVRRKNAVDPIVVDRLKPIALPTRE